MTPRDGSESIAWNVVEGTLADVLRSCPDPLPALARAEFPAIVVRGVCATERCQQIVARLMERQLMYDPRGPVPDRFLAESVPQGYYRRGTEAVNDRAESATSPVAGHRIDIGTSLGYRGGDPETFFRHADQTRTLFASLWGDSSDPVRLIYDTLAQLSSAHRIVTAHHVVTAHESDGRTYGPAIFRVHYGPYTYPPHFDSVRYREGRHQYAVYRYEHQFAGVLVLQNSVADGRTAQCRIHRCLWTPQLDAVLQRQEFESYAREHGVACCTVELQPGDLYFFNTRCIHEVPGVPGELPRIVLATFVGYDPAISEIMVWG